jgi:ABC-type branched-subunit amino acid transport system substrate-binding protein
MAAAGLTGWARLRDVDLELIDSRSDDDETARQCGALAERCDVFFGPYGSGATGAVARALASHGTVIWNHGGAAVRPSPGRMIDVLAPAERYWSGLPQVIVTGPVAVLAAPTGFGRAVASGAVTALSGAGVGPIIAEEFTAATAEEVASRAIAHGARAVIGCGRLEDDIALGRALAGWGGQVGLVACGIAEALTQIGPAIEGWIGPTQWFPGAAITPPIPMPADADYPWAQALAAGLLVDQAIEIAGSVDPDALWNAALAMQTTTFFGPYRVDATGAQTAAAGRLVRWEPSAGGLVRRQVWPPVAS